MLSPFPKPNKPEISIIAFVNMKAIIHVINPCNCGVSNKLNFVSVILILPTGIYSLFFLVIICIETIIVLAREVTIKYSQLVKFLISYILIFVII